MPTLFIDDKEITVPAGTTVLEAARQAGVDIPTLCQHEDLQPRGTCGLCVVEVDGSKDYQRACITTAHEGQTVRTNIRELREVRRDLLELILAAHPDDCLKCIKHGKCELQNLAEKFEIRGLRYDKYDRGLKVDRSSPSIIRDMNKCIACGRCVEVCNEMQSVGSIFFHGRGSDTIVSPATGQLMGTSVCANCGQCVVYCPVGALYEREVIEDVWAAIDDPAKTVVAQIAPAVRVALGEEFGLEPGALVIGKIYAALKKLGVDVVFDTNFTADLTIMEEGTECLQRIAKGGPFPLITSCSPGWIKFMETYYPDLIASVSTCKSPQQMMGALIKTFFADKRGIKPENTVSLSIMPCTAKKFEAARPEMRASGYQDVDYVLTTRELARMIKQAGIRFDNLAEEQADPFLSAYTGAATIFGATGGVMEAALRTAYELKTGKPLASLDFTPARGLAGVKEATVDVAGLPLKIAIAHGLGNARKLMDQVRADNEAGRVNYHFIEIMACPGGCVGGGGQPLANNLKQRQARAQGLYQEDHDLKYRKSHDNPEVKALYAEFLKEPGGHKSHELLHTHYQKRAPYRV